MKLTKSESKHLAMLEDIIEYNFTKKHLGIKSITQLSVLGASRKNFQFLEFIGDRVYHLCASIHISQGSSYLPLGELNAKFEKQKMRTYQTEIAKAINIHEILLRDGEPCPAIGKIEKRLADILEAIYGAVFLDSDHSFPTVFAMHNRIMDTANIRLSTLENAAS